MIKDKNIEFEISKLQKKIDKKSVTAVTKKVTNVTNQPVQPETVLGKPIATDMTVQDGQTLVYNRDKKQWEAGTPQTGEAFTGTLDDITEGTVNKHFTSTEKTKLSGIATGAEVNVQADWNQAGSTADDYIKNKPTIPTVSDVAYDATSWNNNTDAPTKNAVRDKFESLNTGSVPTAWGKYF